MQSVERLASERLLQPQVLVVLGRVVALDGIGDDIELLLLRSHALDIGHGCVRVIIAVAFDHLCSCNDDSSS